jgi:glutathione peroxidase
MNLAQILLIPSLLACSGADMVRIGPVKVPTSSAQSTPSMSFHDLSATDINGNPVSLSEFKGKKVLVVNTASECGYTKQYAQLQELYAMYQDKGLVIIGFPCNDFGGQEPGSEAEIATFCQKNYGVTFPMMSKISVKGDDVSPVYKWLTSKEQNGVLDAKVKWNFHKFLIDEEGRLVAEYGSGTTPLDDKILDWVKG